MVTSQLFGEQRCVDVAKHQATLVYHELKAEHSRQVFNDIVGGIVAESIVPTEVKMRQQQIISALMEEMFCNLPFRQQCEIFDVVEKMWWMVFKTHMMLLKVKDTLR
jgi:hypothetical protein